MGYDLNFWKQNGDVAMAPSEVYQRLCEGKHIEGLVELPVTEIVARFRNDFDRGWTQVADNAWQRKKGKGSFTLETSRFHFRVDCFGLAGADMNRLIDIGLAFDCPLYDPQVGERYSLP
jgi:hypothetical protein